MRDREADPATHRTALDDLATLRIFVAVVDTGSLTEAGRKLGIVPSTVSKHLTALEARVHGQLIHRSTKQLSVTELGRRFYDRCLLILHDVEEAENELGAYNAEAQGLLKITAATSFSLTHMTPIITSFLDTHPKVRINMSLTSQQEDLIANGIDVAIRISHQIDPSLVAVRLAPNERVFCVAPNYVEKHGRPQNVADLVNHNCIVVRDIHQGASWPVRRADGTFGSVPVSGSFLSNNGDMVRQAVVAGLGIGHLGRFAVQPYLDDGRLIELFPEERHKVNDVYAVFPKRRNMPLKTRVFIDHLRSAFKTPPPWAT